MNEQQDRAGIKRNWPAFEVCGVLGHGAYGQVYKIKRKYLGNTTYSALKVIHIPPNDDMRYEMESWGMSEVKIKEYYKELVQNFLNENSVMEKLKGAANIVTVEDCIVEKDSEGDGYTIYIKMELLESLDSLMRNYKLGSEDIVTMGKDICDALIACEQMNVVHRDIKPANVFINSFGTFKLGDFGVAKQMQHTQTGMTKIGTAMYMAPELYREETADKRVDIYSLGIMLYRIANQGCFPFVDPDTISPTSNQDALLRRLKGEELPLPSQVDEELGRIIAKACAHKAEERYGSARELKDALEKWSLKQKLKGELDSEREADRKSEEISWDKQKIRELEEELAQLKKKEEEEELRRRREEERRRVEENRRKQQEERQSVEEQKRQQEQNKRQEEERRRKEEERKRQEQLKRQRENNQNIHRKVIGIPKKKMLFGVILMSIVTAYIVIGIALVSQNKNNGDRSNRIDVSTNEKIAETTVKFDAADTEETTVKFDAADTEEETTQSSVQDINDDEITIPEIVKLNTSVDIGDIVEFGTYQYFSGGAEEPLEWIVLEKDNNQALLISRYLLSRTPYNTEYESVTWENCTLRKWLNDDFYTEAFDEAEKEQIIRSFLENSDNPEYKTDGGDSTEDNIFLLSINEAQQYSFSDEERKASYKKSGMELDWWLRSPGKENNNAAVMESDGTVNEEGIEVNNKSGGIDINISVRPALWVTLD